VGEGANRVRAGVGGRAVLAFAASLAIGLDEMGRREARDRRTRQERQVKGDNCGRRRSGNDMAVCVCVCVCVCVEAGSLDCPDI
jgi:hypothetical protein